MVGTRAFVGVDADVDNQQIRESGPGGFSSAIWLVVDEWLGATRGRARARARARAAGSLSLRKRHRR